MQKVATAAPDDRSISFIDFSRKQAATIKRRGNEVKHMRTNDVYSRKGKEKNIQHYMTILNTM